ncbi:unnamed protein product [Mytilus edulis]|uniref:Uncharacterized protein n=1 Tax=Mytilus edulis TaxID=6550 RepID=A0A8S3SPD1_MYTED|nr:unnamed protein product [Mytilus edulis]
MRCTPYVLEEYRLEIDRPVKYYTIPIGPRLQQLKEVTTLAKVTTLLDTIPQKRPRAPKKLNLYNEILVNELVKLKDGLQVYNAASKQLEMTRVGLLYMVGDVPGIAKEQNRVQQNALNSCSHCIMQGVTISPFAEIDSESVPSHDGEAKKVSCIRRRNCYSSSSNVEISDARYLDLLKHEGQNEGKKTQTLSTAITQHTGRYGSNHWFRLGLDLQQKNAPVEPMHAIKVVAEHIIKLINGDEDNVKVRAAERACGRSTELCPDAVYRIYAQELFTTGMVRFCIRDMLGEPQRAALVNFMFIGRGIWFHYFLLPSFAPLAPVYKDVWSTKELLDVPYERFNHTLTEAISNNQHPEEQWLLSMLEHSGFLEPLKKAVKCVESSLYPGRYNPVTRHASPEELLGIHAYFKERPVSPLIKTFHHARTPKGSYRDTTIESETQKERGSMVLFNNCVGSISLFFSCSGEDLAFISWFGYLDYDTGSRCYFVKTSRNFPNCVVPVKDVSAPLLYAEENGVIWIPKLPDL